MGTLLRLQVRRRRAPMQRRLARRRARQGLLLLLPLLQLRLLPPLRQQLPLRPRQRLSVIRTWRASSRQPPLLKLQVQTRLLLRLLLTPNCLDSSGLRRGLVATAQRACSMLQRTMQATLMGIWQPLAAGRCVVALHLQRRHCMPLRPALRRLSLPIDTCTPVVWLRAHRLFRAA